MMFDLMKNIAVWTSDGETDASLIEPVLLIVNTVGTVDGEPRQYSATVAVTPEQRYSTWGRFDAEDDSDS